jgi:hypothetical protein
VEHGIRRDYPTNAPEFDRWLKANAVVGSILAIGIVAMALAGLYSAGQSNVATDFSSVAVRPGTPSAPAASGADSSGNGFAQK